MNYSIRYKDEKGITTRSEFLPFGSDHEAIQHGQEGMLQSPGVEVWKNDDLVARLPDELR